MGNIVIWALGTGLITGIVGTAIVMYRRRPRAEDESEPQPLPPPPKAVDELGDRVALLEERLEAAEYRLMQERKRELEPRPDPGTPP